MSAESGDNQLSENSLDALLGRVSESPGREIGNLTDRLQKLHDKLKADGSRRGAAICGEVTTRHESK
jgi:hypothetical protein